MATDFLVLHSTGPGLADYEVCAVIQNKKADEGEKAIEEGMTKGPGEYMAVSLNTATRMNAANTVELSPVDG